MKLLNKKGNIGALQVFIMGIAGVAVTLAIVLYVVSAISDEMPDGSAAQNATGDITDSLAKAPTWIGILIIVFLAALVLGYFAMRQQ